MQGSDSEIRIVRAALAHAPLIAPLFDAYRRFYGQPSDPEAALRFISDRLDRDESVVFLASAGDDDAAAVGFTQLYPSFSSVSMCRLWILNDLFVAPAARGRGIAAALLERARRHAAETGAKGLALETARDNTAARRLYEKLGWTRDEAFHRYHLVL